MINLLFLNQNIIVLIFLLLLSLALLLYIFKTRPKKHLTQWYRSLNLVQHQQQFQQLYQLIDGFSLSRKARLHYDNLDYIYGEIEFLSFIALLSLHQPNNETIFYDLGSGIGKAVIACALVYPVQKAIGIELLPSLHLVAQNQVAQLALIPDYKLTAAKIKFISADFFTACLDDATFIFVNSTAFFDLTWKRLSARLGQLPHLKTVITTSKPLLSQRFIVTRTARVQMSWGVVNAYIHQQKIEKILENIE